MIVNGAFQMFDTPISSANTDVLALQGSLAKTVTAASAIDTAISANAIPSGVSEIASAASQLAQALGAATSIPDLQNQTNNLSSAVTANDGTLAAKTAEGKSRAADLVDKVETMIHSWENVHDAASLDRAVKDTGAAATSAGEFLVLLGGVLSAIFPAVGVPLLVAGGVMLAVGSDTGQTLAGTVAGTVAEIAGLPDSPALTQALGQIAELTDGPTTTVTTGLTSTDATGLTQTSTTGRTPTDTASLSRTDTAHPTDGQTDDHPKDGDNGPPKDETTGQPKGEDDGQTQDSTDGETDGVGVGVNTGLIEGIETSQFGGTGTAAGLDTSLGIGKDLGVPQFGVDIPQPGDDIIAELSQDLCGAHPYLEIKNSADRTNGWRARID